MLPQNKTLKLGALKLDLRSYLCPSATSLSRVHGGSDASVCHDTRQSSRSVSVTIVNLVRVRPNEVDILKQIDEEHFLLYLTLNQFKLKGGDLHLQYTCVISIDMVIVSKHTSLIPKVSFTDRIYSDLAPGWQEL